MPNQGVADSFARIGLTDGQNLWLNLFLSFNDTLSFTDATANFLAGTALGVSASDQFTLSDSVGTFGSWFSAQTDSYNLTDVSTVVGNGQNSQSETLNLTDGIGTFGQWLNQSTESLNLSDSVGTFGNWFATQGELISFSDILATGNGGGLSDNFSLSDTAAYSLDVPPIVRIPFPHLYRSLQGVN